MTGFTRSFNFSAALLSPGRLRLATRVATSPPVTAAAVDAPTTFAVVLRPFLRFELREGLFDPEVLLFIILQWLRPLL